MTYLGHLRCPEHENPDLVEDGEDGGDQEWGRRGGEDAHDMISDPEAQIRRLSSRGKGAAVPEEGQGDDEM